MFKSAANRGLAIMVGATVLAFPVYLFAARSDAPPAVLALIAFAVVTAITYACVPWWKSVDEAVREAHKSAWFCGGILACVPLIPALVLIENTPGLLGQVSAGHPYKLFAGGVLITLLFQLTGYLIAWATWWLRRR